MGRMKDIAIDARQQQLANKEDKNLINLLGLLLWVEEYYDNNEELEGLSRGIIIPEEQMKVSYIPFPAVINHR